LVEIIKKYVCDYLSFLINEYEFFKGEEIFDDQSYSIELRSKTFVVNIEKYRREIYLTLAKPGFEENEINLFNLIHYLFQENNNISMSNYFSEIKDPAECYRKQIEHISTVLKNNYEIICHFFEIEDFQAQLEKINKFMLEQYPMIFKQ
jgi:hypothetical protein